MPRIWYSMEMDRRSSFKGSTGGFNLEKCPRGIIQNLLLLRKASSSDFTDVDTQNRLKERNLPPCGTSNRRKSSSTEACPTNKLCGSLGSHCGNSGQDQYGTIGIQSW
jgi:hypothetical protein